MFRIDVVSNIFQEYADGSPGNHCDFLWCLSIPALVFRVSKHNYPFSVEYDVFLVGPLTKHIYVSFSSIWPYLGWLAMSVSYAEHV